MAQTLVLSDIEIEQAVLYALLALQRPADESEVRVTVGGGVVTLTGHVGSHSMKDAAGEAAHRIPGVLDVANDLAVNAPGAVYRSDTEVARAVRQALQRDLMVAAAGVESTVSGGWVTLAGTVKDGWQRDAAEQAILRLPGVRGVTNAIDVRVHKMASDAAPKAGLKRILVEPE